MVYVKTEATLNNTYELLNKDPVSQMCSKLLSMLMHTGRDSMNGLCLEIVLKQEEPTQTIMQRLKLEF